MLCRGCTSNPAKYPLILHSVSWLPRALAEKITVLQRDGTKVHSAIVAAALATSSTACAAAAAALAVAVALAAAKTENLKPKAVQSGNENSTLNGNGLSEETNPLNEIRASERWNTKSPAL